MHPVSSVAAAGAGATWWAEGWRLFARSVGIWFAIAVVYCALMYLLGKIPLIGDAATWLLSPVFIGGVMLGCNALKGGERLRVSHLFDGFRPQHFVPLLLIGVFNVVMIVISVIIGAVALVSSLGLTSIVDIGRLAADPMQLLLDFGIASVLLAVLALIVGAVITMANWFAPTLVVLRDARPLEAMVASFRACMRNWAAFLVYGLIGAVILVAICIAFLGLAFAAGFPTLLAILGGTASLASVGIGFGLLGLVYLLALFVIGVVASASSYASYRDAFVTAESPVALPPQY